MTFLELVKKMKGNMSFFILSAKRMKEDIIFGSVSLWGIYGGVRGWNYYNKVHELKTIRFEKDHKEYPTIYTENKRPHYYYSTCTLYGVVGFFHYIVPPFCLFSIVNEVYRCETYLRNIKSAKNHVSYYDPFYPINFHRYD
jgi:hypothetical protein